MAVSGTVKAVQDGGGDATRRYILLNALALALVLASAFAVILSTHNCREAYAKLQMLEASQWHLQEDHGRLVLEHSTWASHYRVEQVATRDLGMRAPDTASGKVVLQ